jgi:hypothetical protein
MSTLYCGGVGVQKYFLHAQMSIPCVECAITEIYLLLVVLRRIVLAVASLSLVAFIVLDYMSNTTSVL